MRGARQRKTIDIDRGLFLIRYATAEDEANPPKVTVAADPASKRAISLLTHPDEDEAILWRPGACFVARALKPGTLVVEVAAGPDGSSTAASVRVETLTQGGVAPKPRATRSSEARPVSLDGLTLIGHVAGIGDVRVNPGEWLAGPSAPSRIEGISIEWPKKPADLAIRYSVTTAKPQTISQRMVELGGYAGTRGKALALVGIALELLGRAANDVQLNVEATFLGSPAIQRIGPRVSLSGPTGREPLVGLKIALERAGAEKLVKLPPNGNGTERTINRVRVFRNRAKPDQSATL
jgi:hypothetical protein